MTSKEEKEEEKKVRNRENFHDERYLENLINKINKRKSMLVETTNIQPEANAEGTFESQVLDEFNASPVD